MKFSWTKKCSTTSLIEERTAFTEDIRLMLDHEKLDRMLRYLESIDPLLIE